MTAGHSHKSGRLTRARSKLEEEKGYNDRARGI
jgi:hypothetical protein